MSLQKATPSSPFDGYLPDGPIKDAGDSYIEHLPDVENHPLTLESFFSSDSSSWSDYAVAYLLLYPYIVLFAALSGYWVFYVWKRYKTEKEASLKEACFNCGNSLYLCAPHCPVCKADHPSPRAVGWQGFTRMHKAASLTHAYRLMRFRRCHFCGDFITNSRMWQACASCGTEIYSSPEETVIYDKYVQRRKWQVYLIVFWVSWLPIIGALISCSVYRRVLVAPYAAYITFGKNSLLFLSLAVLRFLFRFLPFIGIVGMPVLAIIENRLYQKIFRMKAEKEFETLPAAGGIDAG